MCAFKDLFPYAYAVIPALHIFITHIYQVSHYGYF